LQVSFAINGPPVAIIFITYDGSFSPHKKYFTPSSTPEIAIEVPTLASSKASVILSPGTIADQYRRFLMTTHEKRPTFFQFDQCPQHAEARIQHNIPSRREIC
jgi:hypothetical protein